MSIVIMRHGGEPSMQHPGGTHHCFYRWLARHYSGGGEPLLVNGRRNFFDRAGPTRLRARASLPLRRGVVALNSAPIWTSLGADELCEQ